ncbi:ExbD/TolR family protein [Oceanibacterium hippocampi]|uniref:Biopolymer transport protein ExbD n=1 Tax=Oceanibacterium hippocampi TaxID=745714 RepID=A0A1Y5TVS4_9PROT|nr:biopolymer transporter ExbD [Oceanibacterium hippocampi]SLN73353.1 Biopolymer transport protein ExbD [Oceanibacterium hippocampi]
MAIKAGGNYRSGVKARYARMAEINVTPFVDVMLVLLIVFMVTAPLLTVGVQVDLPKSKAPALPGTDEPLAITIDKAGGLYIQDTPVTREELVPRLQAITQASTTARIFVRGDSQINYGRVLDVMGLITAAGYTRVALVARDPDAKSPAAAAR